MERWTRWIAMAMAVAALLPVVLGCEEQPSTSAPGPETFEAQNEPSFLTLSDSTAAKLGKPAGKRVVTVVIGPEGGVIHLRPVTFTVPKDALSEPTAITLQMPAAGPVFCDFGPEGLVFDKPAKLSLNLTEVLVTGHLETLTWFWWDPAAGEWVDIGGALNVLGLSLDTEIDHFSRYAPGGRAGW